MGTYLQQYGASDEKRNRVVRLLTVSVIVLLLAVLGAYLVFQNFPEEQTAKRFLAEVNGGNYQSAYRDWGCTAEHPCRNYDYNRFVTDWSAASKNGGRWTIQSTDSCRQFLTVNVRAPGTELQSLSVMRADHSLGYAPDSECQERKWRWKQFFQRFFGDPPPPPKPGA